MRERKYRFWDQIEGAWVSDEWINEHFEEVAAWLIDGSIPKEIIINEYIGLKDKNGKEIFEGDILRCCSSAINKNYVVRFGVVNIIDNEMYGSNTVCGFYLDDVISKPEENRYQHMDFIINMEVIGNIYENTDLLEVKI